MRLLILTQAVDRADPVLGFFHRWIEEFGKDYETISVVCLKAGEYQLPENVAVYSLGKERGVPAFVYVANFFRYTFRLRNKYDGVFVHMNQEYVLLGGLFWRLWGKRVVLWRNHKKGSWLTGLSARLSDTVCYTSPEAYVARYSNAMQMPLGIDVERFAAAGNPVPGSVLFLGRLDPVKNPESFLKALEILAQRGVSLRADVYGEATRGREDYARNLEQRYAHLSNIVFHNPVRNDETPVLYATHLVYVNLTPSGSFDKTIGEALSSGCIVVAANSALRGVIPDAFIVDPDSPENIAEALASASALSKEAREKIVLRGQEFIRSQHALPLLASRLRALYREGV